MGSALVSSHAIFWSLTRITGIFVFFFSLAPAARPHSPVPIRRWHDCKPTFQRSLGPSRSPSPVPGISFIRDIHAPRLTSISIMNTSASSPAAAETPVVTTPVAGEGSDPGGSPRDNDRFQSDWSDALRADFIIGIDDNATAFSAEMADISLTGCSVKCDLPHNLNPQVAVLRVYGSEDQVLFEAAGRVCWSRRAAVTSRTFGLNFRRPISQQLLLLLIEQGYVSRREHPREAIRLPVSLRRTSGKAAVTSSLLIDRSRSGVQLSTDLPLEINERILVTLPTGESGMVVVVWTRGEGERYECGAMFQNLTSSRALNEIIA